MCHRPLLKYTSFNPRAREGRDTILQSGHSVFASFNPRAREGRDIIMRLKLFGNIGFNPRAREGRDIPGKEYSAWNKVSIHAPAKGATPNSLSISQPAMFQSTRPRRARPPGWTRSQLARQVSIHAPAKGATGKGIYMLMIVSSFQSTRPRRARHRKNVVDN